jgi:hypothetical protein
MPTIINGSSPSITFSDSTTQVTAGLVAGGTIATGTVTALTTTTLSDGTNSTSATNPIRGSAKAWCLYNGSTQTVLGSFNISSVTYVTTGTYQYNFTTVMATANYATVLGGDNGGSGGTITMLAVGTAYSTTAVATQSRANNTGSNIDGYASIAVFI